MLRRNPAKWLPLGGHIELDESPRTRRVVGDKSDVTSTDFFAF
jgi:hypothetical protein